MSYVSAPRLPQLLAVLAGLTLAADLVVVAGRAGDPPGPARLATPESTPTPTSAATPSRSPAAPVETGLPARYAAPPWTRIPDSIGETGPLDLAKVVELDGDGETSRRFFVRLGFRRGHIRSWARISDNLFLTSLLYEFATPKAATEFADSVYLARAEEGEAAERLAPADVRTLRDPPDSDGDVLRYAILARGPRVALITLLTSDPAPAAGIRVWRAVVAAQATKL